MQYIQLQGQSTSSVDTPLEGSFNLFVDTRDNTIKIKNSEGILTSGSGNIFPNLELTNDALIYEPFLTASVTFTKSDYGSEVDNIDTNISITRGDNQGIYNPLLEPEWDSNNNDGLSPLNTLWNRDGWSDLTNLSDRIYYSFYDTFRGNIGNQVRNTQLVMKDVTNNKYYKFYFSVWGNANNGAAVTYTRQELDGTTGEGLGDETTFVKNSYDDPTTVNDPIDTDLTLARGNQYGIYNIALEQSWNNNGDGYDSPEGTEWNGEGWTNLRNVTERSYSTFLDVLNGAIGENIVGKELIMHDTINNKYYTFKFSAWTQNNNGGGFSYTRQLINTSYIFVKPDNTTAVIDTFVEDNGDGSGIGITRDEYNGIYNPYREEGWNSNQSPEGTLWNIDGWDDFSNITTRQYQTLYAVFGNGGLGNKIVGTKCVMYIPDTEEYYAIEFLSWTQGGGGGFSYNRFKIDTNQLNEGIKFSDGSVLKSAEGIGKIKQTAPFERRIEEITGYSEVSVTEASTSGSVSATIFQDNNGGFSFYVNHTTELQYLYQNQNSYTRIEFSFDDGQSWKDVNICGGNTGNYYQICFTHTPYETVTQNQDVLYRVWNGGEPARWFRAEGGNFRGATIDYHAYSRNAGTIVGTIHIANDDGDDNISHTETTSGGSDLQYVDLWHRQNDERDIYFRRLDGNDDTLKIQWIAKMFYGSEYWD